MAGAAATVAVLGCVAGCGDGAGGGAPSRPAVAASRHRPAVAHAGGAAARYQDRDCDGPALIAHRGETGDGAGLPENTWQSELNAATLGATLLNMDVRWTSDGVPVALHDPTVNRTTSETRPDTAISSLTARQYTSLEARAYAGDTSQGAVLAHVHPDTLEQALARIAPSGRPIVLQMEADPFAPGQGGRSPERDFTDLAQTIEASGYAGRVIVAGWTLRDLAAFHAVAPRLTLAYLFETIGAHAFPTPAQVTASGARIFYVDYRGLTAARVATWHAAGLKVWAWTPATRAEWNALRADDVDAIATNWSASYLTWAPHPCTSAPPAF